MHELTAKLRVERGKKVNALRKAGFLPAVVYGEGTESEPIAVQLRDFEKVYGEAGESSLITLQVEGKKDFNVMINDVSYDPMTSKPIHADFYSVRMDKEIEAKIPLTFIGESPAVKNEGGILVKVAHEIEVRSLPKDLPHEFKVDVTRLEKIGDRLYIRDLIIPAGVRAQSEEDGIVALVEAPRSEKELEALKTEAAPEVAEVKTEGEAKREEKTAKEVEQKTET